MPATWKPAIGDVSKDILFLVDCHLLNNIEMLNTIVLLMSCASITYIVFLYQQVQTLSLGCTEEVVLLT